MGCILKGGGGLYSRLVVGAVLRAGGPAAHVDGHPVGLLELGGVPIVRRLLIALSGAGVDEVVVVVDGEGPQGAGLELAVQDFPITLARHIGEVPVGTLADPLPGDPAAGDAGLADPRWRTGLAALGGKLDAVLLLGVEQALLNTQDLVDLIGAYKKRPEGMQGARPHVDGHDGTPVILAAAIRDDAEAAPAVHAWPTANRRYAVRLAGPQALQQFEHATGHALRPPRAMAAPAVP